MISATSLCQIFNTQLLYNIHECLTFLPRAMFCSFEATLMTCIHLNLLTYILGTGFRSSMFGLREICLWKLIVGA